MAQSLSSFLSLSLADSTRPRQRPVAVARPSPFSSPPLLHGLVASPEQPLRQSPCSRASVVLSQLLRPPCRHALPVRPGRSAGHSELRCSRLQVAQKGFT